MIAARARYSRDAERLIGADVPGALEQHRGLGALLVAERRLAAVEVDD